MRFLVMLTDVETSQLAPGDPGFAERMAQYVAFDEMAGRLGVLRASGKLRPTAEARTIRIRDGKTTVTDGPFTEGHEHIGGLTVIEVEDLDAALDWGRKSAQVITGLAIEVRPFQG